jgi:molybdopterin molybdotransferase
MVEAPGPLAVGEARQRILELCAQRPPALERVPISAAHGRILAQEVRASSDLPAFANSAMDGFALRGADLPTQGEKRFRIVGTRLAGSLASTEIGTDECLRIMTGAFLPRTADTVVIKERTRIEGDSVVVSAGESAGAHVRLPGEDFRSGEPVAGRGERLGAAHLAILASLGMTEVGVARRPRLVVLTTGDELVMPGDDRSPAQIFNSNGYSLAAMAAMAGAETVAAETTGQAFFHVVDDEQAIHRALLAAAETADVILTSGGVSAGDADFLPALIARTGRVHFWKVRMRPGMPFLCGEIGGALVFSLPGNPVSGIATFLALVQPALAALQGSVDSAPLEHPAKLAAGIEKRHPRTEFLRARSEVREDASIWATPLARQGSSMLRGVVEANCLIVVPESTMRLEIGDTIRIIPLPRGC